MYRHKNSGHIITAEVYKELNPKIRARYIAMNKDEVKAYKKSEKTAEKEAAKVEKPAEKVEKPEAPSTETTEGSGNDGDKG